MFPAFIVGLSASGFITSVPIFACILLFQIFPNAVNPPVMFGMITLLLGLTPAILLKIAYGKNGKAWLIGYYTWANEKHKGPFNRNRSNRHIRTMTIILPALCIVGTLLLLYGIISD